ncbi:MAG: hypothetical protein ACREID_04015 [Planctomycetota bacterium]
MKKSLPIALLLLAPALRAQEEGEEERGELFEVGDALTEAACQPRLDATIPGIEGFTRMRFRRPVPLKILPRAQWEQMRKMDGFAGHMGKHAVAWYTPMLNVVTLVPWMLEARPGEKKSVEGWFARAEATLVHEMTHAIHHQNFWSEGRDYAASMRAGALTEREIDGSTVNFLLGEGFAELVSLRTSKSLAGMGRSPDREISTPRQFMDRYRPEEGSKDPFRIKLFNHGYEDGLTLLHHLAMSGGSRAVRASLYRQPPRLLLFQPHLLGKLDLDDPPEPDAIFEFLHTGPLDKEGIFLAVNPGHGRYFSEAQGTRAPGCLLGYAARATVRGETVAEYSFFVADPDGGGDWVTQQLEGMRELNPDGSKEKDVPLPLAKDVKAHLVVVPYANGALHVMAAAGGLVVHARERTPTALVEDRAVVALRALYLKRPKPQLFAEALKKAHLELANAPAAPAGG